MQHVLWAPADASARARVEPDTPEQHTQDTLQGGTRFFIRVSWVLVHLDRRNRRQLAPGWFHCGEVRQEEKKSSNGRGSVKNRKDQRSVIARSDRPRFARVALKAGRKILAVCATLLRVVLRARRAVAAALRGRRSREEWVAYSFDRFIAAIKTRYTPHTRRHVILSHPTTGKKCREPVAFAAADRGDRARRGRGDRHGEAAVIPYDAAGASARACGSVEGSTLGAAEVRRTAPLLHPSRWERCSSYETAHRSRAPLPCAIRSGGGPGGVLPLMGVAFPHGGCLPTSWPHLPISRGFFSGTSFCLSHLHNHMFACKKR